MDNDFLTATAARDLVLYAGEHAKPVPAGTPLHVRPAAIESGREAVYVYAASNHRISGVVYRGILEVA